MVYGEEVFKESFFALSLVEHCTYFAGLFNQFLLWSLRILLLMATLEHGMCLGLNIWEQCSVTPHISIRICQVGQLVRLQVSIECSFGRPYLTKTCPHGDLQNWWMHLSCLIQQPSLIQTCWIGMVSWNTTKQDLIDGTILQSLKD